MIDKYAFSFVHSLKGLNKSKLINGVEKNYE